MVWRKLVGSSPILATAGSRIRICGDDARSSVSLVICAEKNRTSNLSNVLEGGRGFQARLPSGKSLTNFNHGYRRHGTPTLFAPLNVATGQFKAGHYKRRRHREFLDFMNEVIADCPEREIHVILDNLNTHKPKHDGWLARHPSVHFHYTPTHASWLNQVEVWFSILSRRAQRGANSTSPRQVRNAIDLFLAAHNKDAAPFAWRKRQV